MTRRTGLKRELGGLPLDAVRPPHTAADVCAVGRGTFLAICDSAAPAPGMSTRRRARTRTPHSEPDRRFASGDLELAVEAFEQATAR